MQLIVTVRVTESTMNIAIVLSIAGITVVVISVLIVSETNIVSMIIVTFRVFIRQ